MHLNLVLASWLKGQYLWVRIGRDGDRGLTFVVRRAIGTAVERNRLKRRLRAICREIDTHAGPLVVLALPPSVDLSFQALRDELKFLLSHLIGSSDQ